MVEETIEVVQTVDPSLTQISSLQETQRINDLSQLSDYEVEVVTSIEDSGPAVDPSLEDDEFFEDVKGVIQKEQAAETLENIIAESEGPIEFKEELIPQGGVTAITEELTAILSEEELNRI